MWTWSSWRTSRPRRCAAPGATCTRSPSQPRERDMPVSTQPISLFQETATEFGVILAGVVLVCAGALFNFRRVRMERPPVGTFNGRDIVILLGFIVTLPFLYGYLPIWL